MMDNAVDKWPRVITGVNPTQWVIVLSANYSGRYRQEYGNLSRRNFWASGAGYCL